MSVAVRRPILLDVTRLISRSWTRRRSTGIDRVCNAYLANFRDRAQAVVQYRGIIRLLNPGRSDLLFDMLQRPDDAFRREVLRLAPEVLFGRSSTRFDGRRAFYLNVSHTDFDLPSHVRWARMCHLRPIYFLHDLIPISHASLCRPLASRRHSGRVISALTNASGIIVNSDWTASELNGFARQNDLDLPPLLTATLSGAELAVPPLEASNDQGEAKPYFVCVGSIEPRKNHMLLLDVWEGLAERLGDATPQLVIIGQWGRGSQEVRRRLKGRTRLGRHVKVVTDCPDRLMGQWIKGAQALLCPTLAEGFGLPLVEALKLGVPVIASDIASSREVGQGIPTLLDPHDREAWNEAVTVFTGTSPEKARQLQLMRAFKPQTWTNHFTQVETWLNQLKPRNHTNSEEKMIHCSGA